MDLEDLSGPSSDQGDEGELPRVKAIRIPLVMDKITKLLPIQTLLALRPVCQKWNHIFARQLQKQDSFELEVNLVPGGRMETYTELMQSSQRIPFGRYSVSQTACAFNPGFFSVCGPVIRVLNTCGTEVSRSNRKECHMGLLRHVIFNATPNLTNLFLCVDMVVPPRFGPQVSNLLPNLRFLGLSTRGNIHPLFTSFLNDLVRCAVGLEYIELMEIMDEYRHGQLQDVYKATEAILTALRDSAPTLNNLRGLRTAHMRLEELSILEELGRRETNPLRLSELRISAPPLLEYAPFFTSFLQSQCLTVTFLELNLQTVGDEDEDLLATLEIPKFDNLTELQLTGCGEYQEFGAFPISFIEGTLANTFPKLNRFGCDRSFGWGLELSAEVHYPRRGVDPLERLLEPLAPLLQHNGLKQLDLSQVEFGIAAEELALLGAAFPSVTHLRLTLLDSGHLGNHGSMWTTWAALEILHLRFHHWFTQFERYAAELSVDSFLSGVQRSAWDDALATASLLDTEPSSFCAIRDLLVKHKTSPGISDLKHLRKFTMELPFTLHRILTDIGGYFGLAMASPTLQHLEVGPYQEDGDKYGMGLEVQISTKCRELIRSALGPNAFIQITQTHPTGTHL